MARHSKSSLRRSAKRALSKQQAAARPLEQQLPTIEISNQQFFETAHTLYNRGGAFAQAMDAELVTTVVASSGQPWNVNMQFNVPHWASAGGYESSSSSSSDDYFNNLFDTNGFDKGVDKTVERAAIREVFDEKVRTNKVRGVAALRAQANSFVAGLGDGAAAAAAASSSSSSSSAPAVFVLNNQEVGLGAAAAAAAAAAASSSSSSSSSSGEPTFTAAELFQLKAILGGDTGKAKVLGARYAAAAEL